MRAKWLIVAALVIVGMVGVVSANTMAKVWSPKDKVNVGEDGILEVDVANTFNETVEYTVYIDVPTNVMVSSSDVAISGSGGIYIAKFTVDPNMVDSIRFTIHSDVPGEYIVSAKVYYKSESGSVRGTLGYNHPFTFEKSLTSEVENMDIKTIGFGIMVFFFVVILVKAL